MNDATFSELVAAVQAEAVVAAAAPVPPPPVCEQPSVLDASLASGVPAPAVAAADNGIDLLGLYSGGMPPAPEPEPQPEPQPNPEPVFAFVCFPSELIGAKPRRIFIKAEGGTIEGLRRSLRERLSLPDEGARVPPGQAFILGVAEIVPWACRRIYHHRGRCPGWPFCNRSLRSPRLRRRRGVNRRAYRAHS